MPWFFDLRWILHLQGRHLWGDRDLQCGDLHHGTHLLWFCGHLLGAGNLSGLSLVRRHHDLRD